MVHPYRFWTILTAYQEERAALVEAKILTAPEAFKKYYHEDAGSWRMILAKRRTQILFDGVSPGLEVRFLIRGVAYEGVVHDPWLVAAEASGSSRRAAKEFNRLKKAGIVFEKRS